MQGAAWEANNPASSRNPLIRRYSYTKAPVGADLEHLAIGAFTWAC
jgi:hypothetical protein